MHVSQTTQSTLFLQVRGSLETYLREKQRTFADLC